VVIGGSEFVGEFTGELIGLVTVLDETQPVSINTAIKPKERKKIIFFIGCLLFSFNPFS